MKTKSANIASFLSDKGCKGMAKSIVVNKYRIPPQDFEDLLFEALATAAEWWSPDRGTAWTTSVFITLESACLMYKRKNKKGFLLKTFDYSRDIEGNTDTEREVHFRELFNQVIEKINEVEDEENRLILLGVLLNGEKYDDVCDNPPAARKMVERFREGLKQEFGNELAWEG